MTELSIGGKTARTAQCDGCGAEILWVLTAHGKPMPLDAIPDPAGNVVLTGQWAVGKRGAAPTSRVVTAPRSLLDVDERTDDEIERFMPHFATCEHVDRFRRHT